MKPNTYITFDTETQGIDQPIIYDLAYAIHDKHGNILETRNHLITEVITNSQVMGRAFYHGKVYSDYIPLLASGKIDMMNWQDAINEMNDLINEYDVNIMAAYNIGFDKRAMAYTHKIHGQNRRVLNQQITLLDLWLYAAQTIMKANYKRIALSQGWVSDAGNIRTTAETAYRYLTGNMGFIEDHTALSDVMIEIDILTHCIRQKKRVPYNELNQQPWRIVNA